MLAIYCWAWGRPLSVVCTPSEISSENNKFSSASSCYYRYLLDFGWGLVSTSLSTGNPSSLDLRRPLHVFDPYCYFFYLGQGFNINLIFKGMMLSLQTTYCSSAKSSAARHVGQLPCWLSMSIDSSLPASTCSSVLI